MHVGGDRFVPLEIEQKTVRQLSLNDTSLFTFSPMKEFIPSHLSIFIRPFMRVLDLLVTREVQQHSKSQF